MTKKFVAAVAVIVGALLIFGCGSQQQQADSTTKGASTATQNKADPQLVEEVKAMLAKHDEALNDKNIEAVMSTFSADPDTVLLGTGEGERFVGQQAIKEAYTEIFKDYEAGTLISKCDWKTGETDAAGTTAWLAATCALQDAMKDKKREYVLNVSGALQKQGADWRFVMLHMSNSTSGPPPPTTAKSGD